MWETIAETTTVVIQSCENNGDIQYRVIAYDDATGKEQTINLSPHEVINILCQSIQNEIRCHQFGDKE